MFRDITDRAREIIRSLTKPGTPLRRPQAIDGYIKQHFAADMAILDDEAGQAAHVDVHVVRPSTRRPYYTLITAGMSDHEMSTPGGEEEWAAEACLCLPPDWLIDPQTRAGRRRFLKQEHRWPVSALKQVARHPRRDGMAVSWGQTMQDFNPNPLDPAGRFAGAILLKPATLPEEVDEVIGPRGKIRLLGVVPLLTDELEYRQSNGRQALEDKLMELGVTELLQPGRRSVVT